MAQRATQPVSKFSRFSKKIHSIEEHDADVREFFHEFGDYLTEGNAHLIASQFKVPAFVLCNEFSKALLTVQEVEKMFSGVKELYNQRGITEARPVISSINWANETIAIVEVRWPYIDGKGDEIGQETSTYTLQYDEEDELRLRAIVMHGEQKCKAPTSLKLEP